MKLTGTGIWNAGLRFRDAGEVTDAAAELEELGYTSIWMPDYNGGMFEAVERLLAATKTITVASGIMSVWVYDPEETAAARARLTEHYGPRFLVGLGVSHAAIVETVVEGAKYEKPLLRMQAFLDGIDAAPEPIPADARVLAALGPKMLDLAARRAGGAHPYNVTPEHTAIARARLGPTKLLVPEQGVVLRSDADEARRIAREFLHHYLETPNYANNLRRLGFDDDDLANGGSDRIIDAVIAWGDEDAIAQRVQAHRDAGADSVCVQVLSDDAGMTGMPRDDWRRLAPALTAI